MHGAWENLTMSLLLVSHDLGLAHRAPPGHPERAERLTATVSGLRGARCEIIEVDAPAVDRALLEVIHDASYVDEVRRFCAGGGGFFDPDTFAVPASWDAALHAAGAGPAAVDALERGDAGTAFVAVRPPGHHAERHQAMGFCLFNNVAVTAAYLSGKGRRVAVVDWDVHHGNGTQNSFWSSGDVLYLSLHEFPFYPGTGWVTEVGVGMGKGVTVNVPLPEGTSSEDYRAAFARVVLPIVKQFAPDWILISAGFDAHVADPLGGLRLESNDYGAMARALGQVVPPNRIIAFLEGGYDLDALATSSVATVEGLLGIEHASEWPRNVEGSAGRIVDLVVEQMEHHWDVA
jgi:acetoin utilization deacetylase AcuC-like enzyme